MKIKLLLLATILCFFGSVIAVDSKRDELMWKSAYDGNFSLTYRLALTRCSETLNDALIDQFAIAYLYYRLGNEKEMKAIFKGVDSFIERHIKMTAE
jgi:hypothetical protein